MISVQFLALAQNELDDAYESYEYQEENLGKHFVKEVKNTLSLIKTYRNTWSKSSTQTRRCFIKGFPYSILYYYEATNIYVIALVNLRKKPIHWVSKSVSEYSTSRISSLPETMYTR